MPENEQLELGAALEPKAPPDAAASSDQGPAKLPDGLDESIRRMAQSLVAQEVQKATGGVAKLGKQVKQAVEQFDAQIAAMREKGMLSENANVDAMRQQVMLDAMAGEEEGAPQAQAPNQPQQPLDPWALAASQMATKYGLMTNDPELAEIVEDQGPEVLLETIVQAGLKKQARIQRQNTPAPQDLIGGGRGEKPNPIADMNDPAELLEKGLYG